MNEDEVKKKMEGVISFLSQDLGSIRTGRATTSLVDNIVIAAYGGTQKLHVNELATVSVSGSESIVIDPWDKSIIGEIKQGVLAANVGLNPVIDGEVIRINIPAMTGEDRQKYVKLLHTKLENSRIMVRRARSDAMHDLKEAFEKKEISEDERFAAEKKLQEVTDEYIGKIDELGKSKEKELLLV